MKKRQLTPEIEQFLKDIAARSAQLCSQAKLSQADLAAKSGVSVFTLRRMMSESGADVSLRTIEKICDALDITPYEFFSSPEFNGVKKSKKEI